jgi:hypothetical protein
LLPVFFFFFFFNQEYSFVGLSFVGTLWSLWSIGVQTVTPSAVPDATTVSSNASPVLSTNVGDTSTLPNVDTALPTVQSASSLKKYKDSDKNSDCESTTVALLFCVYQKQVLHKMYWHSGIKL